MGTEKKGCISPQGVDKPSQNDGDDDSGQSKDAGLPILSCGTRAASVGHQDTEDEYVHVENFDMVTSTDPMPFSAAKSGKLSEVTTLSLGGVFPPFDEKAVDQGRLV
uniref:Uncharacterized protein n=1 Tax=Corethron hystrix TaxID=216773 RepID=A0A7S1FSC3_9STRA|mmetsp:Transcript_23804/g.54240  ORF Transcript_23804/g.54240 Transcript_23804/m.54240 type:complete len:107 (+) Transcript_23804:251-571(+)